MSPCKHDTVFVWLTLCSLSIPVQSASVVLFGEPDVTARPLGGRQSGWDWIFSRDETLNCRLRADIVEVGSLSPAAAAVIHIHGNTDRT